MEIFNPIQYAVGLNSNIKLNNLGKNIYFGQGLEKDTFQSTSPTRFCNELEIKKLISNNPELKKILKENKIPVRLNMAELKDLMENHCKVTQDVSVEIFKNLPQALKQQVNIKYLKEGAILHDFGKVLIPAEILNKKGALTEAEHKIMDLHSVIGYELLKNAGLDDKVLTLIRYHHENSDGHRHFVPDINLQIINLADKYSALTEKRVYKEALTPQQALMIIYGDVQKGTVHPFLFNALVNSINANVAEKNVTKC